MWKTGFQLTDNNICACVSRDRRHNELGSFDLSSSRVSLEVLVPSIHGLSNPKAVKCVIF